MEEQKVNITYETLFDLLRMEKRRDDLQEIQKTFFADVVSYMKQKKEILTRKEHESGIDKADEIKKMNIQYENIQKIIRDIYERREKKIILMALNKSRTRMNTLNTNMLLPHEREFYEKMAQLFDSYRTDVAEKVSNGILPKLSSQCTHSNAVPSASALADTESSGKGNNTSAGAETLQVKFLQETEEFVGPELEVYGPFEANAVAVLPAKLASIFITTGIAEEVKN